MVWLQYYIASGVGHVHVKKLAYDVCKAVQLSDLDYEYIASGIKARDATAEHIMSAASMPVACQLLAALLLHVVASLPVRISPCRLRPKIDI